MWPPQNGVRLLLVERAQMSFVNRRERSLAGVSIYINVCAGGLAFFGKAVSCLNGGFEKAVRGSWKSGRSPTIRRINFKKSREPSASFAIIDEKM